MCGITGWVSFERDLGQHTDVLDAMTATMACRGPDDEGTWVRGHAALGHRRLAIIDLPGGTQPMAVEDDLVAMVYSGEAYNFVELRDELRKRGHTFRTDSDTEVVLRGYLEWGPGVADHLNGMYAFAIWDTRTEQLVMIRDRMGVKPFYYYPTDDGVLFGSEPKAILANPAAERVLDLDGLRELMVMVKTPGHGIWSGVREAEPGTVVTVDRKGIHTHRYWQLTTAEHPDDQETSVARVRELLDDIVRRQLISDVPRCLLLSGGLDSSALTALAAVQLREQGETVRSFAVDFVGQTENFVADEMRGDPDAPFAHDVAEHSKTEHEDIVLDSGQLADPDLRRTVITARDLPAGMGDMDFSLYLLFKAIRSRSTVALSGESADEVFGGYRWFHMPEAQQAKTFPWMAFGFQRHGQVGDVLELGLATRLDLASYIGDAYQQAVAAVDRLPGEDDHTYRMRQISHMHLTRFVRNLLDRKDRMSMAVGLEVRVPFCDHRLVEYVYNAPWSLKTYDGREKSLLRGATADVLPRSVVDRVKSPYPSTQDVGYLVALQQQGKELLAEADNPVYEVINRQWLAETVELDPAEVKWGRRFGLERALDMSVWLDLYRPTLQLG